MIILRSCIKHTKVGVYSAGKMCQRVILKLILIIIIQIFYKFWWVQDVWIDYIHVGTMEKGFMDVKRWIKKYPLTLVVIEQ